jgi:DNA repair protein RecN (Recombination protein N)
LPRHALAQVHALSADLDLEPGHLERIEERYFALKDLARKHGTEVDRLAELRDELSTRLAGIDSGAAHLAELARAADTARAAYLEGAEALSAARTEAAARLDAAVNAELPPLKLEKARFHTTVERLAEEAWGGHGLDRVGFEASTNRPRPWCSTRWIAASAAPRPMPSASVWPAWPGTVRSWS